MLRSPQTTRRNHAIGRDSIQCCSPEEFGKRNSVPLAKLGQFDHIDSAFARFALGNERRVRAKSSRHLYLCQLGFLSHLAQHAQNVSVFLRVTGFFHGSKVALWVLQEPRRRSRISQIGKFPFWEIHTVTPRRVFGASHCKGAVPWQMERMASPSPKAKSRRARDRSRKPSPTNRR